MHITIETSSKTGQSCTLNGSGHIHRLTTYQNHRGPAWGKCRSFTLQRPLKANDAAFKIGTSPRRQIEEHPLRSNSSVEAAYVTRTNHGQWPSVRHKWSSPSSSSCLPNLINKTWPRWHSRWHLAVAVFVIDCSLLMLPNHVGAAKGLPDRIPVGESIASSMLYDVHNQKLLDLRFKSHQRHTASATRFGSVEHSVLVKPCRPDETAGN